MNRLAKSIGAAGLLVATLIHSGCGGGDTVAGAGIASLTPVTPPDAPQGITNESPMARPASVAWTAARAKRCGFFFDPVKLRTSYLAFESRQGAAADAMAKIESTYDGTYKTIYAKVAAEADYCNEVRAREIKAELSRHLAGDYAPNLPKPIMMANCGMFGCAKPESGKFEAKKVFDDLEKNRR